MFSILIFLFGINKFQVIDIICIVYVIIIFCLLHFNSILGKLSDWNIFDSIYEKYCIDRFVFCIQIFCSKYLISDFDIEENFLFHHKRQQTNYAYDMKQNRKPNNFIDIFIKYENHWRSVFSILHSLVTLLYWHFTISDRKWDEIIFLVHISNKSKVK